MARCGSLDGDGNRAAKTVGGATTRYLVDTQSPTGYAQVVEEVSGGATVRSYTHGLDLISQNQLVGGNWTPSFYGYDGQGSVRYLTNSSGAVTDTYDYDAFGNILERTGATPNNYLYRGEQFDSDLGSYFLRARYYDQLRGALLSSDESAASPTIRSRSQVPLCEPDPGHHIDPSGYSTIGDYARLGGAIALNIVRSRALHSIAKLYHLLFITVASVPPTACGQIATTVAGFRLLRRQEGRRPSRVAERRPGRGGPGRGGRDAPPLAAVGRVGRRDGRGPGRPGSGPGLPRPRGGAAIRCRPIGFRSRPARGATPR